MPIALPAGLPAARELEAEGIAVVPPGQPGALKVLVFNLMPLKESTERQLARMFGQSAFTVEMTFAIPDGAAAKNTDPAHLAKFYSKFSQIRDHRYDGVVVTGAPVEHLPFEEVKYWPELEAIFNWIGDSGVSMYSICWGSMASLKHFHGIPKHLTEKKLFGSFPHEVLQQCEMTRGLHGDVTIPVSRHAEWKMQDMDKLPAGVDVVVACDQTGPCVIWDPARNYCHMMNHFEYELDSLDGEYRRDLKKGTPTGEPIPIPFGYFPDDNPDLPPVHKWQSNGVTFYNNWIAMVASRKLLQSKL